MKTHLIVAVLSASIAANLHAELKWAETTLELHPAFGEKQAVGHFKYQNTGKTPIKFTSVKTSCGCTVAQTQKDEVAPGEEGEITATYNIGANHGTVMKTVTVETDDAANPNTLLYLKTVITEGLSITPSAVLWKAGEESAPKMINIKADKDFPAKNLTVAESNSDFSAEIKPGSTAGEWTLVVKPKQTAKATAAILTIKPDQPKDLPRPFAVTANVMGPPAPAASSR